MIWIKLNFSKIKNKLESTLDDMEDALEKEKRARVEQDKLKRKIESDLKLAQSSIEAVERKTKEVEAAMQRKDKELGAMADKLEEEQAEVVKSQKQIKDMAVKTLYLGFDSSGDCSIINSSVSQALI